MSIRSITLGLVLAGLICPAFVNAQDNGNNNNGGNNGNNAQGMGRADRGNNGGGRGNWDPAQMRERMLTGLKEQLGANDEDWKALEPKVGKVFDAQRDARSGGGFGGRGGFGGGRGGQNGGNNAEPTTELGKASKALRDTLQDKDASADSITQKLEAFRDARKKAEEELATSRKELRELVTPRQEAVLVMAGMLD